MAIIDNTSIIIPSHPQDQTWISLLSDFNHLPQSTEIIIVGPHLNPSLSSKYQSSCGPKIKFLYSEIGRAKQLNTGALSATNENLWFVHSDSRISADSIKALETVVAKNSVPALFYFDLKFLGDGPLLMPLNSLGATLRSSILGIPFGDQGFFIKRNLFLKTEGYDEVTKYGEDHLFVWSCKRQGILILRVNAPIFTSARKYKKSGWISTTLRHLFLTIYQIGIIHLKRKVPSRSNPLLENRDA